MGYLLHLSSMGSKLHLANMPTDYPIRVISNLREHLRSLRRQRGLTQAQLGHKLGIGQVRVAEIEKNPGLVSLDQILRLLSILGATLVLRDTETETHRATETSIRSAILRLPAVRRWRTTQLSGGSISVSREDGSAATREDLQRLRTMNPDWTVAITSARNLLARPRKGAW